MNFKLFFVILLLSITSTTFGQTDNGKLYRANKWGDAKKNSKGKPLYAYSLNPTIEKVEILITEKEINVSLGKKILNYKIISKNKFSEVLTNYTVTAKGKSFKIGVGQMPDGTFAISNTTEWFVGDISDISTTETK